MISEEEYLSHEVVNIHTIAKKSIVYSSAIEKEFSEHAEKGYPHEICGFMLGKSNENDVVTKIIQVENKAKEKERRFEINPVDYMKVERTAAIENLDVIGIYHSHPNYPAIPSVQDLKFAQKDFAYIIISVEANGLILINSWKK